MFETLALVDATILVSKGHELSRIRPNGGRLLVFEFDALTDDQASAVLSSSDATLLRTFHRVLRDVRKRMDAVSGRGDGR